MKFHRLLAGTAVAALMATNASALDIELEVGTALVDGTVFLAAERNATAAAIPGSFEVIVNTNNPIASANNYFITLDIINGEFAADVDATDLLNGTGRNTQATLFNGTTIQFDGSDRTGEDGDTSVRFLSSAQTGGDDFSIQFEALANCAGPLNFRVTLTTEAGTPIEEGVDTLGTTTVPAPAAICVDAYLAQVVTDVDQFGNNDSVLRAPAFATFVTPVASPVGIGDDSDEANVGVINVLYDWTRPLGTGARTIFPDLGAAEDITSGALAADATDIGVLTFTIELDNTVGVQGVSLRAAGGTPLTLDANGRRTLQFNPTTIGTNLAGIEVDLLGNVTLQETQPSVRAGGTMTFTGNAATLTTDSIAAADLDFLQYAGARCGTFDWVGDGTLTRRNVFRVTNFANAVTDGIFATMTNSSAGMAASTRSIASNVVVNGAELSFTDQDLTAVFGNYGRADFNFNFIGATSSLDCDRLQSSPVDSIVTGFGNGTGVFNDGDD